MLKAATVQVTSGPQITTPKVPIPSIHSLGGGTGVSLESLLIVNGILFMNHLIENRDVTVCVDTEDVLKICTPILNSTKVDYDGMNHIIATMISGLTTCFRSLGPSRC